MKKIDLENDTKIETGYKIPKDYFDNFEAQLMQRINTEKQPSKVISLNRRKLVWASSIAAAIVVALGTWMYSNHLNTENNLSAQEYLAYQTDISTEDIASKLTDEDVLNLENELVTIDTKDTQTYINDYLN